MHPQPHSHPVPRGQGQPSVERLEGVQQAEPGADGPLGVVFVRYGVAKIRQHPIAQVLGQIAVKALNHLCTGLVVGLHHLPEVFRVQATRQRGRVDQVTEQYREGAAFRLRRTAERLGGSATSGREDEASVSGSRVAGAPDGSTAGV